jgi:hypothetical protein
MGGLGAIEHPYARLAVSVCIGLDSVPSRQSAQRAHSKLQKPPSAPASLGGAAAATTNMQWRQPT